LDEIQGLCDNLDMAQILDKVGGMAPLIRLIEHEDPSVRSAAADTLAVAVQNDEVSQHHAAAHGALSVCTAHVLRASERCSKPSGDAFSPTTELSKSLFALASLVRGAPDLTAAFVSGSAETPLALTDSASAAVSSSSAVAAPLLPEGAVVLLTALRATSDPPCVTRVLGLLKYLLDTPSKFRVARPSMFASLVSDSTPHSHALLEFCRPFLSVECVKGECGDPYLAVQAFGVCDLLLKAVLEARLVVAHGDGASADQRQLAAVSDAEQLHAIEQACADLVAAFDGMPATEQETLETEAAIAKSITKVLSMAARVPPVV
jgi:hypothetical protein